MVHADGPVGLGGVAVAFDDERAVADAGMVVLATLAGRLGWGSRRSSSSGSISASAPARATRAPRS
jgi:hypothetical protein